jgi:hypothetical protein
MMPHRPVSQMRLREWGYPDLQPAAFDMRRRNRIIADPRGSGECPQGPREKEVAGS